jgi:ActR/RegA family two-component response regulator
MDKLVNLTSVIETVGEKIEEEIGFLVDAHLDISLLETNIVSKRDFFDLIGRTTVLTRFDVNGDREGECYLFFDLKDAILLAGILVMLPGTEIQARISKETFGDEENDAFGEIANIISGALSTSFEENYRGDLHFVKKSLETVNKNKLDPAADDPFPEQDLFLAAYSLKKDGEDLKPFHIAVPTHLLELEAPAEATAKEGKTEDRQEGTDNAPSKKTAPSAATAAETQGEDEKQAGPENPAEETAQDSSAGQADSNPEDETVLILSDSPEDSQIFVESLETQACDCICKNFHEDIKELFQTRAVKGVFLVMKEVSDQGFATVIKIKSAAPPRLPIIAAGPRWTRSTVLQAVKYGSCDVLMTPATVEEIQEKTRTHIHLSPPPENLERVS